MKYQNKYGMCNSFDFEDLTQLEKILRQFFDSQETIEDLQSAKLAIDSIVSGNYSHCLLTKGLESRRNERSKQV
jgi:microcompartment protein CcmK/EutM